MALLGITKRKNILNQSPQSYGFQTNLYPEQTAHGRVWKARDEVCMCRRFIPAVNVSVSFLVAFCLVPAVFFSAFGFYAQQVHIKFRSPLIVAPQVIYPRIAFLDGSADRNTFKGNFSAGTASLSTDMSHTVEPVITTQKWADDSEEYAEEQPDAFETETCKAMYPWQLTAFPACNPIHEIDMTRASVSSSTASKESTPVYLTYGYRRDVWVLQNTSLDSKVVLKTGRFMHNFTARNFDRNRRDSLVMERLTKSAWILNIYGYCANSGLSEYAAGGDISSAIWGRSSGVKPTLTYQERMHIAVQAAIGLAELHNFDKEGQASVAHTDIAPDQFVKVEEGRYKLQDFNRARLISWDTHERNPCSYKVERNPGKNRSPEEYMHKPQSEKVDLYSLGNIFYMLLENEQPFDSESTKDAQKLVKDGHRPHLSHHIRHSHDPYIKALRRAMHMCHAQEPEKRLPAREVANYLKRHLEELEPGILQHWGEKLDLT